MNNRKMTVRIVGAVAVCMLSVLTLDVSAQENLSVTASKKYVKQEVAKVYRAITNDTPQIVSNVVTKSYVEGLGISGGGSITIDDDVIEGSTNAVSGGAVYQEIYREIFDIRVDIERGEVKAGNSEYADFADEADYARYLKDEDHGSYVELRYMADNHRWWVHNFLTGGDYYLAYLDDIPNGVSNIVTKSYVESLGISGSVPVDQTITEGSTNAVSGGAVYAAVTNINDRIDAVAETNATQTAVINSLSGRIDAAANTNATQTAAISALSDKIDAAAVTNSLQDAAIDALDKKKRSLTDMTVYAEVETWTWTCNNVPAIAAAMNQHGTGAEYHTIEDGYASTGWSAVNLPSGWSDAGGGDGSEDAGTITVYIMAEIDGEPYAEAVSGTRSSSIIPTSDRLATTNGLNMVSNSLASAIATAKAVADAAAVTNAAQTAAIAAAAEAATNYTDNLKIDLQTGMLVVGKATLASTASSADTARYLEWDDGENGGFLQFFVGPGLNRWVTGTNLYEEREILAYLSDIAAATNRLASASAVSAAQAVADAAAVTNSQQALTIAQHTTDIADLQTAIETFSPKEKKVAMFILPLNFSTNEHYVAVELKATTNNFQGAVENRTLYFAHTSIPSQGNHIGSFPDGARIFIESHINRTVPGGDQRSYVRITNTWDIAELEALEASPVLVVIVDAKYVMHSSNKSWLSDQNEELIWTYARCGIGASESSFDPLTDPHVEKDQKGRALWRPCAPVRWFKEVPQWARDPDGK